MAQKKADSIYSTPLGNFSGYLDYSGPLEILSGLEVCMPTLPAHMNIAECRMFYWKIKASEDRPGFRAVCTFEPTVKVEGGPESGERLDAQGWSNERYSVSLGTDDGEALDGRASKNTIPKRFMTNHPDGLDWVKYTDYGFEIHVPALQKNEQLELRFSMAWKQKDASADDISTWYAVDLALPK